MATETRHRDDATTRRAARAMRRATRIALTMVAIAIGASSRARGARIGPERAAIVGNRADEGARASSRGDGAPRDRAIEFDRIERVSWRPHAEVYRGFLTREECDHVTALATPSLEHSTVVDASDGGSVSSDIRTSSGMFLLRGEDEVVASIERRVASWTHVPESHGEGFQVLRYELGQEYRAHFDYFHDEFNQRREKGGQRVATVLMYLTDVEEGGETIFPDAEAGANPGGGDGASSCAAGKLAVKPRKGDALFFRSLHHNGTFDKMSMHAGCPVVKGVKFSATKWMHVAPIQDFGDAVRFQPGVCKDVNAACKGWASSGECTKNPSFMVGRGRANGNCMRSCGACPPGTRDD